MRDSLKGKVLTLERNDDLIGSREGIDRDHSKRGGRVYKNVVVLIGDFCESFFKNILSLGSAGDLQIRTRKIDRCRNQIQVGDRGLATRLGNGIALDKNAVGIFFHLRPVYTQATGCISLRIGVHEQYPALPRNISGQIDGRGGLADTAFLINNGPN